MSEQAMRAGWCWVVSGLIAACGDGGSVVPDSSSDDTSDVNEVSDGEGEVSDGEVEVSDGEVEASDGEVEASDGTEVEVNGGTEVEDSDGGDVQDGADATDGEVSGDVQDSEDGDDGITTACEQPCAGAWTEVDDPLFDRWMPALAELDASHVLAVSGEAVEVLDLETGSWSTLSLPGSPFSIARTAARLDDGLVWAPYPNDPRPISRFDVESGEWSATEAGSTASNYRDAAVNIVDGAWIVYAGGDFGGGAGRRVHRYDVAGGRWLEVGTLLDRRDTPHVMVDLGAGELLIGGGDGLGDGALFESYDVPTGTNMRVESTTATPAGAAAVLLDDGDVLLAGGGTTTAAARRWDAATGRWSAIAPMLWARRHFTLTLLGDGSVLAAGGEASNDVDRAEAERYDPVADTWRPVAPMAVARSRHGALALSDGRVLVLSGKRAELFDPDGACPTNDWCACATMTPEPCAKACGNTPMADRCGIVRSVSCGSCAVAGTTCSAGVCEWRSTVGWPLERLAERGVKELLAAREVAEGVEAYYATRGSIEGPDTVRRATNFGSAPREATVAAAASVDIPHQAVVFDGPTAHVATYADGIQVSHLVAGRWRTNTLATNLGSNVLTPLFGFAVGADLPILCFGRTLQSVGRILCAEPIDGAWRESQVDFADHGGSVAVSRTVAGTFVALVRRFSQMLIVAREGAQGEWSTVELDNGLDYTVPPLFVAGDSGLVLVAREVPNAGLVLRVYGPAGTWTARTLPPLPGADTRVALGLGGDGRLRAVYPRAATGELVLATEGADGHWSFEVVAAGLLATTAPVAALPLMRDGEVAAVVFHDKNQGLTLARRP